MIALSYDEKTGIISTITEGAMSRKEWDDYIEEFLKFMQLARSRHGRVLHLVDASGNGVQSREDFREMARTRIMHSSEEDQTAIVLHSVPAKMQLGQLPDGNRLRFFSDLQEAREWLLEGGNIARRA